MVQVEHRCLRLYLDCCFEFTNQTAFRTEATNIFLGWLPPVPLLTLCSAIKFRPTMVWSHYRSPIIPVLSSIRSRRSSYYPSSCAYNPVHPDIRRLGEYMLFNLQIQIEDFIALTSGIILAISVYYARSIHAPLFFGTNTGCETNSAGILVVN